MQVNCHECAELPPSITAKDSRKSQRGWIVHHNAPKITGVTVISYFHWHANGEFSRSHDVTHPSAAEVEGFVLAAARTPEQQVAALGL